LFDDERAILRPIFPFPRLSQGSRGKPQRATLEVTPRDGSLTLSDVREPILSLVCEPCGRRGRYGVDWLMAKANKEPVSPWAFWAYIAVYLATMACFDIRRS
jgi:hypothetical protein